MSTEDQRGVIDFLAASSTHGCETVQRIDTHASIVFLAGARAYKLKRAVRFDYLDFSTSERRRTLCEAEVRLNRRTAPTLYRGVVAVTRQDDGSYALGGKGAPVDWLVEMNQFPHAALFDRLASVGALGIELIGLAPAVGAVPGAVVLRSDETRKRLCNVPLLQPLDPDGYSSHVSERVYHSGGRGRTRSSCGPQRHCRCRPCAGG